MKISDFHSATNSGRLLLVDFYASWCGACSAMEPTLNRLAVALSDIMTILRIDTSTATNHELVERYNIVAIPTLILFHHGDVLWRESGIVAFDELRTIIRQYSSVGIY